MIEKITELFVPMIPPTVTDQEKRVAVRNNKPVFYRDEKLAAARAKIKSRVAAHRPKQPYICGVRLTVKWIFPLAGTAHSDGEYRITKPDTDNLNKMLKDVMTECKFWDDDALVASEIIEKFWGIHPGIYIRIEELPS